MWAGTTIMQNVHIDPEVKYNYTIDFCLECQLLNKIGSSKQSQIKFEATAIFNKWYDKSQAHLKKLKNISL